APATAGRGDRGDRSERGESGDGAALPCRGFHSHSRGLPAGPGRRLRSDDFSPGVRGRPGGDLSAAADGRGARSRLDLAAARRRRRGFRAASETTEPSDAMRAACLLVLFVLAKAPVLAGRYG